MNIKAITNRIMKTYLIFIFTNLILATSLFGQIFNPTILKKDVPEMNIVKINKTRASTTVYFSYTSTGPSRWICAGKDFFIRDCKTKITYNLIRANGIPVCPDKHTFKEKGQILEFNLVFPTLPVSTSKIDIIENELKKDFNFFGVDLSESNKTVYEIRTVRLQAKMRDSDSPTADVIFIIPKGTKVKPISLKGGYYEVEYKGTIGYINELYLNVIDSKTNNTPSLKNDKTSSQTQTINETNTLTIEAKMRASNSPIADIISIIPAGTQVKTISLNADYYKVEYKGKIGYINEMYFKGNQNSSPSKTVNNSSQTQTNKTDSKAKKLVTKGRMRESASPFADVIYEISAGTQVKMLSFNDGYYKVEYKGRVGFLNEMYFGVNSTKGGKSSPSSNSISTNRTYNNNSSSNSSQIQTNSNCNEIKYFPGSKKPTLRDMLAGVKYAVIVGKPDILGQVPAFKALHEKLENMGLQVKYMSDDHISPKHLCEEVYTSIAFSYDLSKFSNVKWIFRSPCNDDYWELSSYKIAKAGLYDNPQRNFYSVLSDMYPGVKPSFQQSYRMELPTRLTCWNETKLKNDFQSNGLKTLEGIYENTVSSTSGKAKYKVGVKSISGKYHLVYLSGANNSGNWKEGELKATLETTATANFYKANWVMANKSENSDFYVSFENGLMNVISPDKSKDLYIKLFPSSNDNITSYSNVSSSGTGFAISSTGLIVTNNHVIEGAKTITVRGLKGDFSKTYSAKLIITDKNNDLAIIKIDEYGFNNLGSIPYVIKPAGSSVGEDIFVLGYPLRATMGDEIKLTNGIISSKTGYQGDVTSYQISAPVQPGNSGGPLFDGKGQLIGIINAKHIGAENASYAVKVSYLSNLIDLLDDSPRLQTSSSVYGKPLPQQVQIIKKHVYIIEVK